MAAVVFGRIERSNRNRINNKRESRERRKKGNQPRGKYPPKNSHLPPASRDPLLSGVEISPLPLIDWLIDWFTAAHRPSVCSLSPLPTIASSANKWLGARNRNKRTKGCYICPQNDSRAPCGHGWNKNDLISYFVLSIYSLKWSGLKVSFSER